MNVRQLGFYVVAGLGVMALVLLAVGLPAALTAPRIGVILWDRELNSFVENLQGVVDGLRETGYREGLNLRIQVEDAGGNHSQAALAAKQLDEAGVRLLITLGTVPTLAALEVTRLSRTPVVYSHVGEPEASGLVWPEDPEEVRFTGTGSGVSAEEQLRFLLLAMPGLQRLGILHSTATPVAVSSAEAWEAAAHNRGLQAISVVVPEVQPESLQKAMRDLINENIEVLLIPRDPLLLKPKNLEAICEQAGQAFLAVVGPTRDSLTSGAFMAYHSDMLEIGRQTGRQAGRILAGAPLAAVPPEKPRSQRLSVNLKTAEALDLTLSKEFLSRAYQLLQ